MHNELQKLLNIALKDNVLTDKEKEILFRKAKQLDVDMDEFEMELEGILSQIEQGRNKTGNADNSSKTKCLNCGAEIPSLSINCEFCGFEITKRKANSSIEKLYKLLNSVEDRRKEDSDNPLIALGATFAKSFSKSFGGDKITRKKIEIISSFPVPNTKSDILEFLSHAVPKAKKKGNFFTRDDDANYTHNELVPTWKAKCEQIIIKARFSFTNDKKTLSEVEKYAKQLKIK